MRRCTVEPSTSTSPRHAQSWDGFLATPTTRCSSKATNGISPTVPSYWPTLVLPVITVPQSRKERLESCTGFCKKQLANDFNTPQRARKQKAAEMREGRHEAWRSATDWKVGLRPNARGALVNHP